MQRRSRRAWALPLALGCALPALGQYPGRIENKPKDNGGLRAVAVLEWTGEAGKPSASRLVPITVFDGEHLQDGGLYLARPEPLALDSGTEYELERAGVPQGWFDVFSAGQMSGDWFGFGVWKPEVPVAPKKLPPAREMPQVVKEHGDTSGPHFSNKTGAGTSAAGSPPAAASGAGGNGGGQNGADAGKQNGEQTQTETPDPERPTLRRRPKTGTVTPDANAAGANTPAETVAGGADPDRPHLTRGKPAGEDAEPARLETTPVDLRQMVGVSDATNREPQRFAYQWPDPADAMHLREQMETVARQALAGTGVQGAPTQSGAAWQPAKSQTKRARQRHAAMVRANAVDLQDVKFAAYELTYGGGATLVLTASALTSGAAGSGARAGESAGGGEQTERYVTVIAQPDIYGALQVLYSGIADSAHLDDAPRMRLVDAVDAKGDRRGDLLFELRGATDRRFALYRVASGQVQPIFTTDALPIKAAVQ